jgi:tRNA1Val (adenine37-N6)-methyltransferase
MNQTMTENEKYLIPDEEIDDLQNGYSLIQSASGFRFGMDAVLLAAFAKVKKTDRVMDLCTGNGIVPILLAARTESNSISGIEIQEKSADQAKRSVLLNHLEDRIRIFLGDIREAPQRFGMSVFQTVTCNPPYMIGNHGLQNPDEAMAIARHEILCTMEDVIRTASHLLVQGGRFFMVHRPFRLAEMMKTMMMYHLEPKRMRLVYPFVDKEPNMVLIEGRKGGNSRITVEKPLIVYEKPGVYTEEIRKIYRGG